MYEENLVTYTIIGLSKKYNHIVGFLRHLILRMAVFHDFIFTNGSAKSSATAMGSSFFKGLNFTNDQYPRNSQNLHTYLKNINYTVHETKQDNNQVRNCNSGSEM